MVTKDCAWDEILGVTQYPIPVTSRYIYVCSGDAVAATVEDGLT